MDFIIISYSQADAGNEAAIDFRVCRIEFSEPATGRHTTNARHGGDTEQIPYRRFNWISTTSDRSRGRPDSRGQDIA